MSDILDIEQSNLVFLHSPLNKLAQITRFLQIRFSQGTLPWQWHEDTNLVIDPDDQDGPGNIFIDAEFALEKDYEGASPALIVTRGSTVHPRPVVGDQGPVSPDQLTKAWEQKIGFGEMDIRIQCISQNKAECAILGDVVQTSITMTRKGLTQALTLRDISEVVLSPTVPYIRDKDKWQNNVDFRVFYEQRWRVIPAAPVLDRADVYMKQTLDAANYVRTFALKNQ